MNKRMRELLALMREQQNKADEYLKAGDSVNLNNTLEYISELQAAYSSEKAVFELEKNGIPKAKDGESTENKLSGFDIFAKMLQKKPLTEAENALITGGASGEDYIVPEDVDLSIREARRSYISLKDQVTVYPTTTLSGSRVYDTEDSEDLTAFDDGDDIGAASNPKFTQKKWTIGFYGKTFPISNILLGAEKAGLMAYINRWFIRKAIRTENKAIITALKKGKSAVDIAGLAGLKEQINTKIEDDYLIDGVILTNHTGFQMLDGETDAVGRPMLTRDPYNPTERRYMGLPVIRVSDSLLPNESSKAPIFIGSLKAGICFFEYTSLQFAVSEHILFNKNQTALRIIEGFDVEQEFPEAYIYGLLSADTGKVVKTKAESTGVGG